MHREDNASGSVTSVGRVEGECCVDERAKEDGSWCDEEDDAADDADDEEEGAEILRGFANM